jgi:hypothetical protein
LWTDVNNFYTLYENHRVEDNWQGITGSMTTADRETTAHGRWSI